MKTNNTSTQEGQAAETPPPSCAALAGPGGSPAEITRETLWLCEVVADLAGSFVLADWIPEDSRELNRLSIEWARSFEQENVTETWQGTRDYIGEVDKHFDKCYTEWLATNPPRQRNISFEKQELIDALKEAESIVNMRGHPDDKQDLTTIPGRIRAVLKKYEA